MTGEDVKSELEKQPFVPLRIHLVSGKTVDVTMEGMAWMLRNAVCVLHDPRPRRDDDEAGYDVIALRNIERLEQLKPGAAPRGGGE